VLELAIRESLMSSSTEKYRLPRRIGLGVRIQVLILTIIIATLALPKKVTQMVRSLISQ
jgi:hypothetical protein